MKGGESKRLFTSFPVSNPGKLLESGHPRGACLENVVPVSPERADILGPSSTGTTVII